MRNAPFITFFLLIGFNAFSQTATPTPYFDFSKGIGMTAPDSIFSVNIRFRMQNRVALTTFSESDLGIKQVEALVRRVRLRFGGFVYSPKLTYNLQLSFTRGDMDWDNTQFPNVVRDAYIQYQWTKRFSIGFGQTKLPGNRQRVISSGEQQLVDRSIVNAAFNIDRDFGVQFNYRLSHVALRGAISSGEGRNIAKSDNGLAYTGRIEFLPLGAFTNGGDYFEGDLMREQKPKLSIGIVYSHNHHAVRQAGQLGLPLYEQSNIGSFMVDALYKYAGWAFSAEYHDRTATNPITDDGTGNERYVYVGTGQNYQLSYLFIKNWEVIGRYSNITPAKVLENEENIRNQYTIGLTKYLRGHRVKIQNDLSFDEAHAVGSSLSTRSWTYRFQIELGI